ncbi:hypothetical protein L7F22_009690 [Adiantum nelumboides]|nr:hypothetical protein [Adiantum nelumboides]
MWSAERMDEDYRNRNTNPNQDSKAASSTTTSTENLDHSDSDLYFDPPRAMSFSLLLSTVGLSEFITSPIYTLPNWGFRNRNSDLEGKGSLKNMFTSFVLENFWRVYESTKVERSRKDRQDYIFLNLKIHPRDLKSKDPSILLQAIFAQWLPLSSTTFSAIVTQIPSPSVAQRTRMPSMLHPSLSYFATQVAKAQNQMEVDLYESKEGDEARRIGYVSKMFAVKRSDLPDERRLLELNGNGPRKPLTADEMRERAREAKERREKLKQTLEATGVELGNESSIQLDEDGKVKEDQAKKVEDESDKQSVPEPQTQPEESTPTPSLSSDVLLGFSRLYSGTLRVGDSLSVVLPKYDASLPPSHPHNKKHCKSIKIENLYMIMGRELINVKKCRLEMFVELEVWKEL